MTSMRHLYRLPRQFNRESSLVHGVNASRRPLPKLIHTSHPRAALRPFLLSDPGEGIKEVQIIQWFVQPGARVEEFDKICEVASDKANIEITSRFAGVIKKLHHDQDTVVQVGQALVDIDVQSEISPEDEALLAPESHDSQDQPQDSKHSKHHPSDRTTAGVVDELKRDQGSHGGTARARQVQPLATPAVRGFLKSLDVEITEVAGTGKDGRILKEDVHAYIAAQNATTAARPSSSGRSSATHDEEAPKEHAVALTPIQAQMFKTMTRSLSIPHFLYADEVDFTALSALRRRLNSDTKPDDSNPRPKLTYLPFIIKAVSLALTHFPILNARVEVPSSPGSTAQPKLIYRAHHNIGIAIATPSGLLVPNIKNVAALSITTISTEIARLQGLAIPTSPTTISSTSGGGGGREVLEGAGTSKLTPHDLTGGTFTVSNIGSIGGTYVAPVLVPTEVGILGIGRVRIVPGFAPITHPSARPNPSNKLTAPGSGPEEGESETGELRLVEKSITNLSWSGDHRVVDGATLARMAEMVRRLVEEPEEEGGLVGYL